MQLPDRFYGDLTQLISLSEWMADQPCTKPDLINKVRCAKSAKADITWMCPPCKFRHLVYGPYCDICKINHKPDDC